MGLDDDMTIYIDVNKENILDKTNLNDLSSQVYEIMGKEYKGVADVFRNFIATFPAVDSLERLAYEIPKHINIYGNFFFVNHDGGTIVSCAWRKPLLLILEAGKVLKEKEREQLLADADNSDDIDHQILRGEAEVDNVSKEASESVLNLIKREEYDDSLFNFALGRGELLESDSEVGDALLSDKVAIQSDEDEDLRAA